MADISNPQIAPPEVAPPADAQILDVDLAQHLSGDKVSISLKYYHNKSECWSEWQKRDLKDFAGTIEKLRNVTVVQLRQGGGPGFDSHKGKPAGGFKRPKELSEDLQFCEIRLSKKARIHGFIVGAIFFLVWLDRNHQAFPE